MKLVYIAHPIGGDASANVAKVLAIVKEINLTRPDLQPFAPYIVDVLAMDDSVAVERERGFRNNRMLFFRPGAIDVLYLCGDRISEGMEQEILWALALGIKIVDGVNGEII